MNPREINLSDKKWSPGEKPVVKGVKAAVSADNAVVTHTMLKILEEGGNAVDAGIAGCLLQAAVEPFMTNLTGSVVFLYYSAAEDRYYQLDSMGTFPADLPPHMPVPEGMGAYSAIPPRSVIPGFMPGLKELHGKFATMPWAYLCEEAIWWAENGHHVSSFEASVNDFGENFITFFPEGRAFYMPEGRLPEVGDRFGSKKMAETLRKVAKEGPDYMVTGEWAAQFIEKANSMGWNITEGHMTANPPRWIEPLRFKVREYEIVSLAPPQSQGVYIALVLGILDKLGIDSISPYSAEHIFYMGHALKLAQQICSFVNDPVVFEFDINRYLDPDLHARLADMIKGMAPKADMTTHMNMTTGFVGSGLVDGLIPGKVPTTRQNSWQDQPSGSCELSIVDKNGNWVQMMNTLQSSGIPGQVVGGVPMIGSHALPNAYSTAMVYCQVPGARMRVPIGNTMVLKDGKPVMQLGTPGNVHVTVPQVLCNYIFYGMEPYDAIRAPRMLSLTEGGTIIIEDRIDAETQEQLLSMGVRIKVSGVWDMHMGSFQVCYLDKETGELCTTVDPRRCGVADGLK